MLINLFFIAAVVVAVLCPETAVGKALKRLLIEGPAKQLNALTLTRIVVIAVVFAAVTAVLAIGREDGLFVLAQAVPDSAVWFLTFDVSAYIDLIALAWLLAASVRLRAASLAMASAAARARQWALRRIAALQARLTPVARNRSRRGRPGTRRPPSGRGDEERPELFGGLAWA